MQLWTCNVTRKKSFTLVAHFDQKSLNFHKINVPGKIILQKVVEWNVSTNWNNVLISQADGAIMQPVRTTTAKTISQVITTRVSRENCHENCRDTLCHNFVGFYQTWWGCGGGMRERKLDFKNLKNFRLLLFLCCLQYFLPKILLLFMSHKYFLLI